MIEQLKVKCSVCGQINKIEVKRIYDAYEGTFSCENCGELLDMIHNVLDE